MLGNFIKYVLGICVVVFLTLLVHFGIFYSLLEDTLPVEESLPRYSLFDFNGYECWLGSPTDIIYKTGSPNIVIGITCPLEVQYIFQPAIE